MVNTKLFKSSFRLNLTNTVVRNAFVYAERGLYVKKKKTMVSSRNFLNEMFSSFQIDCCESSNIGKFWVLMGNLNGE